MSTPLKMSGETAVSELTKLYESYGYTKYKMSKFEVYDLYAENKSFLKCENIITFSDLSGRLLALKPDVTLSIVKSVKDERTAPYKLYYNENIYRVNRGSKDYSEIRQVGLEYIGEVDLYSTFEVISLAVKGLDIISSKNILDLSHLGFINGLLNETQLSAVQRERVYTLLSERNAHELKDFCTKCKVDDFLISKITALSKIYGDFRKTISAARTLSINSYMDNALAELENLYELLKKFNLHKYINLDFSIVNDVTYYNGIIFQGFIEGIPGVVLSGGRYDNLLKKLGKNTEAIGFAVYTDTLNSYFVPESPYDVDCVLIYDENDDVLAVSEAAHIFSLQGKSVLVQKEVPKDIKAAQYYKMIDGKAVERNELS
ncbi:MAG TPA: ATP phosphoribosyltransferase regulatory subunit [Oscillospiraceae bacterium]|nr:ATP phosphoribosyltransferase regulatory subunit [Oscillospiraceae bacterium]